MNPLLFSAYTAYSAGAGLRRRRDRCKRYTYGDQWSDIAYDRTGNAVSEADIMRRLGRTPLTNNLIRQLVKTIVGRYRADASERRADDKPSQWQRLNRLPEIDSRMLEEFVISGCAIQRVVREHRIGGDGPWVDNVDPRRFFVNSFTDPRGNDIELIGMLHDMSAAEIVNRFGAGSRSRARRLSDIFSACTAEHAREACAAIGLPQPSAVDFLTAAPGRCRVIELWTLEADEELTCRDRETGGVFRTSPDKFDGIAADNASRASEGRPLVDVHSDMRVRWHYRFIAPDGTVLAEGDSPYAHGSHPFAVKMHPLTDGEVHSFVEDVIDQQRNINRLITLIDHIMATSAKGVLLFPVSQLPKGWSWNDVADRWSQADGILPVSGQGYEMPRQVVTQGAANEACQLLSLQLKLFEETSGISDALLGRNISAATGSELYRQQVRNASVALTDLLETFADFTAERDRKANNC